MVKLLAAFGMVAVAAIAAHDQPQGDPAFERVLLETSAHYLLGVEVADEHRDGKNRAIRVEVNRRGTTVRARSSAVHAGEGAVIRPALASVGIGVLAGLWPGGRGQPADLDELLAKAATFIADFERDSPAIVSEEAYRQVSSSLGIRTLRSDMLIVADPDLGSVGFRDVYEVDGRPVRDRDERLMHLFLKPHADRIEQARRIVRESARHNLQVGQYDVTRTINMPLVALRFLRRPNQHRSEFRLSGTRRIDGRTFPGVTFQERAMPRVIASPENAAAFGRFWIDPANGAVVRSELSFETGDTRIRARMVVRVSYGIDERLQVWMPLSMEEEYLVDDRDARGLRGLTRPVTLTTLATYSNFRRFAVDTSVTVKTP